MTIDKQLFGYFLKAFLLYIIWYLGYECYLLPDGRLDAWLNDFVATLGNKFLTILGYNSCQSGTSVCVNGTSTVIIGSGCNGLEIYCIFAGFIIIYEGKVLHKFLYILIGSFILFSFNIARVVLLSINRLHSMQLFYYNHKYTYVFIMYTLVFVLWLFWVVKLGNKSVLA
jgi:exosortase/archaeosortase family protein